MRTVRTVITAPEFRVHVVTCTADEEHGWCEAEQTSSTGIVLVHRGMFRMRADGHRQTVDPTLGYVQPPGAEQSFAHPAGGDVCTFIEVSGTLGEAITGDGLAAPGAVVVDATVELAHRLLLRSGPDAADPAERLVHTLTAAVVRPHERRPGGAAGRVERHPGRCAGRCAGRHAGRRMDLADQAREAIVADHPESADLLRLARLLGVSPSHLSRTFHAHTGMTLSRFRNRVRVSRALARIEAGETDLARLAAEVGFADQAHLGRIMRAETGETPGRLRDLFACQVSHAL